MENNFYCPRCQGSGEEPSGWSLEQARFSPEEFNSKRLLAQYGPGHNVIKPFNRVVSPLLFFDNGVERCVTCGGTGRSAEYQKQLAEERELRKDLFFTEKLGVPGTTTVIERFQDQQFLTIQACYNNSDSMSDYHDPHRTIGPCFALAVISAKKRQTERTARGVVSMAPELSQLTWTWGKETYRMGNGLWLQSPVMGEYPDQMKQDGTVGVRFWYEVHYNSYDKKFLPSKYYRGVID